VLLDHDGLNEYIDTSGLDAASLHGSPPPIPGVAPVQPGEAGGVRQLSERQYVMARSKLNSAITNLPDLTTKARIAPSFKNGVADGFKLRDASRIEVEIERRGDTLRNSYSIE
jgi:general secretion pathway protein C